ncbi:MAG: hypothetical protein ACREQX_13090 [Candidatus Binataceae bacterium]
MSWLSRTPMLKAGKLTRGMLATIMLLLAGCGGAFGVGNATSPGNTPNVASQVSFRIVGTVGTPFVATISDADASWVIHDAIPLSIVIIQNKYPARMVVTKTANDSSLLSAQIITGFKVQQLSSTSEPFGSAVVAINGTLNAFAPAANPDVRFVVTGPNTAVYDALIEQGNAGQVVQSRAPSLLLLDTANNSDPTARIDGIFNLVSFIGGFNIALSYNGAVVRNAIGGTSASMKFP